MAVESPEGPVTIMFTDIEGSTALRTSLGDERANAVLREHYTLVREQVQAHHGHELKTIGDGFLVAFTSVRGAIACAVAIQRGRESHGDHPAAGLRVRIGLNTGEVLRENGDVSGEAVHAAQRICDRARGVGIVVANVTKELAGTIPGVTFTDRGQADLKGFPTPWRLWQVEWRVAPENGTDGGTPSIRQEADRAGMQPVLGTHRGIRVLLVDDQELVRAGLRRILQTTDDLEVVGECTDGAEVPDAVHEHRPDVVLMDIRMKGVDGVEATRRLRERDGTPPVLVLTTFDDDELLSEALRAGAAGFQLKDAPGEEIVRAIRTVAEGEAWLDPGVTGRVLKRYQGSARVSKQARASMDYLTPRELEVLKLVGRGSTNSEIAQELVITEVTVKSHITHIFAKLGLRDRAATIVFAFDSGLVTPQP